MPDTSALREIGVGVRDLEARVRFYGEQFGLSVTAEGELDANTAARLWGLGHAPRVVRLGRPDVPGGPSLRLVAVPDGATPRPGADLLAAGPVGIGFTTRGVESVHARVRAGGVCFVSPPLRLTPGAVGPTGPVRKEAFGQAEDGEFVVLIERVNAETAYGVISDELGTSEPLHSSHIVSDLEACSRFMAEALGHETVIRDRAAEPVFENLMGLPPGTGFRFEMLHRRGTASGRIIFIQYEGRAGEAPDVGPPARGVHALRYDCGDVGEVAARIEPAGGRLLSGPMDVDSAVLGRGRVIVVRPPFGTLLEIWQPSPSRVGPKGER